MTRYRTHVEDGTVYVGSGDHRVEVGDVDTIVETVGGPAWTISYTDAQKERYPDMDTSDEGLTVDVVDMMQAMTHSERFVETLAVQPETPIDEDEDLPPRAGLFVGKLLENLEHGVD